MLCFYDAAEEPDALVSEIYYRYDFNSTLPDLSLSRPGYEDDLLMGCDAV
jgi:hypothetical protein